jgi:hypothetical protein
LAGAAISDDLVLETRERTGCAAIVADAGGFAREVLADDADGAGAACALRLAAVDRRAGERIGARLRAAARGAAVARFADRKRFVEAALFADFWVAFAGLRRGAAFAAAAVRFAAGSDFFDLSAAASARLRASFAAFFTTLKCLRAFLTSALAARTRCLASWTLASALSASAWVRCNSALSLEPTAPEVFAMVAPQKMTVP